MRESRVARSDGWDCGRKMWTCWRAEFIVDFSDASASASEFGFVGGCCSSVPC